MQKYSETVVFYMGLPWLEKKEERALGIGASSGDIYSVLRKDMLEYFDNWKHTMSDSSEQMFIVHEPVDPEEPRNKFTTNTALAYAGFLGTSGHYYKDSCNPQMARTPMMHAPREEPSKLKFEGYVRGY